MDSREQKYVIADTHFSEEPEIGRWLWALQDTRRRTMSGLEGLTRAIIDWLPPNNESSIGTVLYHIALIEVDWLYTEVLEQPIPQEILVLFPYDDRDEQGHLTQVRGFSLEQHLGRLESVRRLILDVFQQMNLDEFRRIRSLAQYDVSPEWVLHHWMQHEAEHRSQIGALRTAAARNLAQG